MSTNLSAHLADDVITLILDLLGQPGVLAAAGVSRRWRRVATAHKSFYRSVTLLGTSTGPYDMKWDPRGMEELMPALCDEASDAPKLRVCIILQQPNGGGVSLMFTPFGIQPTQGPLSMSDEMWKELIVPALELGMSRIVELTVIIAARYLPALCDALKQPLPCLRELSIYIYEPGEGEPQWTTYPTLEVGTPSAPLLTTISLGNVQVGRSAPMPHIRNVTLQYTVRNPLFIEVGHLWPNARSLEFSPAANPLDKGGRLSLNLAGMSPQHLCLKYWGEHQWIPRVDKALSLRAIPSIEFVARDDGAEVGLLFEGLGQAVSLRIYRDVRHDGVKKAFELTDQNGFVRAFSIGFWSPSNRLDATQLQVGTLANTLVDIRMPHAFLDALFALGTPSFPVLTSIRIDLEHKQGTEPFWPLTVKPDRDSTSLPTAAPSLDIACPNLTRLVLHDSYQVAEVPVDQLLQFASCIRSDSETRLTGLVLTGVAVPGSHQDLLSRFNGAVHEEPLVTLTKEGK